MASFEDASRYVRVQFFLAVLGFGLLLAGMVVEGNVSHNKPTDIAFHVLSFVFYLLTLCLSFSWTFVDQARSSKGVYASNIVFAFLSAIFVIAHVSKYVRTSVFTVSCLLYAASIVLAILVAAFTITEIAGDVKVKFPTIPSPRKAKKEKKDKDIEAGEEEKKDEVVELEESPKEEKKEEEAEEKPAEGATNGQVVKEEEEKEDAKEEKKEEVEEKKDEEAAAVKE